MLVKSFGPVILVGLLLAASAVPALAADTTVAMLSNDEFSPETVTVQVGDTVTWVNRDTAVHDSVARGPLVAWNTGYMRANEQVTVSFDTATTYNYHCRIHPGMTGRVIVVPAPPATDTLESAAASTDSGAALAALFAALVAVLAIVRRNGSRRGSAAGQPLHHS